jgi:FixJ family two-component response regulator
LLIFHPSGIHPGKARKGNMIAKAGVYVVEDEDLVRNALVRLISLAGYDTRGFATGTAFLESDCCHSAGCLLLDFSLPDMSGLQVQETLQARDSRMPVIFMSGYGDVPLTVQAMKHGALDFLTKPVQDSALFAAITVALAAAEEQRGRQDRIDEVRARLGGLTRREHDVLDGVLLGRLNKQIARELGISEKTVKVHRGRLMAKMGVRHVAHLAQLALQADYRAADTRPDTPMKVVSIPSWRRRA